MQIYTHAACLAHDTGPDHPERPERLRAVLHALEAAHPDLDWQQAPPASRGQLLRVHDPHLLDAVLETAPGALQPLDPDTPLSPRSAEAALRAAGAGVAAVDAVLSGRTRRAFCAVRPPGHHATAAAAMGFCLFNNVAVAARHAIDRHGLERVAIVDFDVHHGNGTQAIFEREPARAVRQFAPVAAVPGVGRRATKPASATSSTLPLPKGTDGAASAPPGARNCCRRWMLFKPAAAAGVGRLRRPPSRPAGRAAAGHRRFRLADPRTGRHRRPPRRRQDRVDAGGRLRPRRRWPSACVAHVDTLRI